MEIFTIEFCSTLFILSAMLLVARFKEEICKIDKSSFVNISAGLSIFSVVSLMTMFKQTQIILTIPFLNVPIFFDLVTYIAVISGAVMLVSGVGAWIPLMRELKTINRSKINQLSMIKKVSRLSRIETRVEVLISTFKNYVVDEYNFSAGALFLLSPQKELSIFHNATGAMFDREDSLKMIEFDFETLGRMEESTFSIENISKVFPSELEAPQLILPLYRKNRMVSLLMFWSDEETNHETVSFDPSELGIPLEMLNKRISELSDDIKEKFNDSLDENKKVVTIKLERAVDIKEKLSIIATGLKENCKADFVSLIDLSNRLTSTRYSVGGNQSVLQELKVHLSVSKQELEEIFSDKDFVSVTDSSLEINKQYQTLISNPQAKAMIIFPVKENHSLIGLFTIASDEQSKVGAKEKYVAETFLPMITEALLEDQRETEATIQLNRMKKLREFISYSKETDDLSEIINLTAAAVIDDPAFEMVRISTFDFEASFLDSKALLMSQKMSPRVPGNGHQILSLMPLHVRIQEDRKTMIVDQSDRKNRMEDIEMNQSLAPEITNLILHPVIVNDQVTAVVSAGNSKSIPVGSHETEYVKALSTILAMHFRYENIRNILTAKDSVTSSIVQTTDFTNSGEDMNDALSRIIGSVERLKDKEINEADHEQLLKKISSAARSINEYVTEIN